MNQMKYKLAVLAVGAACTFGSWGMASAATMSTPAGQSLVPMSEAAKGTVELVRNRGGRHYRRHGGHHRSGRHHSRRHYGRHHGRRHHHHGRNFFFAAPFFYGGLYGYDYGYNSCYRECRYYNGPRYCRYHWRRYCY